MHAELADPRTQSEEEGEETFHPLLVPNIHQLAASKTVSMAFASSLPHLRAYLASYLPPKNLLKCPLLIIYGLIDLHRATTDYSVQGLSRSLAIAVETAELSSMRLLLVEDSADWACSNLESGSEAAAVNVNDPWKEQVPFLNSSVLSSGDRLAAGRTVEIGAVIAKWCDFQIAGVY
ncbi:MAG: hypothetical protein LQ337_002022 [Flavoplaca oasis]|nr:MAG: hypothetical protein LQ337_002022 [Flavoplaca oasis]